MPTSTRKHAPRKADTHRRSLGFSRAQTRDREREREERTREKRLASRCVREEWTNSRRTRYTHTRSSVRRMDVFARGRIRDGINYRYNGDATCRKKQRSDDVTGNNDDDDRATKHTPSEAREHWGRPCDRRAATRRRRVPPATSQRRASREWGKVKLLYHLRRNFSLMNLRKGPWDRPLAAELVTWVTARWNKSRYLRVSANKYPAPLYFVKFRAREMGSFHIHTRNAAKMRSLLVRDCTCSYRWKAFSHFRGNAPLDPEYYI